MIFPFGRWRARVATVACLRSFTRTARGKLLPNLDERLKEAILLHCSHLIEQIDRNSGLAAIFENPARNMKIEPEQERVLHVVQPHAHTLYSGDANTDK